MTAYELGVKSAEEDNRITMRPPRDPIAYADWARKYRDNVGMRGPDSNRTYYAAGGNNNYSSIQDMLALSGAHSGAVPGRPSFLQDRMSRYRKPRIMDLTYTDPRNAEMLDRLGIGKTAPAQATPRYSTALPSPTGVFFKDLGSRLGAGPKQTIGQGVQQVQEAARK
jgi:hypothetical protein